MTNLPREQWVAALSRVAAPHLADLVAELSATWTIQPKALPQSGLGMLKMRDGAQGEAFYLGEFPVSLCRLGITTETGQTADGAAWLLDDKPGRAEQMAVCDAVLSAQLPGWERVAALLEQGQQLILQTELERKTLLARTRVEFSLLQEADDDDA